MNTNRIWALGAVVAIAAIGFTSAPAWGQTFNVWFMGETDPVTGEVDQSWDDNANWSKHPPEEGFNQKPFAGDKTYISTTDKTELMSIPPAVLDVGDDEETGVFYVGGWEEEFDVMHGIDRTGHAGVFDVRGGLVTVAPKNEPVSGLEDCNYMRVGFRGATGEVLQSGGEVRGCHLFSIGYWGEKSLGIWRLSGGLAAPSGFDLGIQGAGFIDMTGGSVVGDETVLPASSYVGRASHLEETGFLPGVGLFNQRAGNVDIDNISIGVSNSNSNTGASGTYAIRSNASLRVSDLMNLGKESVGSLVQTGGVVEVGRIWMGRADGGIGHYTISDGVFVQAYSNPSGVGTNYDNIPLTADASLTPNSHKFFNGSNDSSNQTAVGQGNLVVASSKPFLRISTYYQNGRSRWTFVLDEGHLTQNEPRVEIWQKATFRPGAEFDIDIMQNETNLGGTPAIDPADETVFELIEVRGHLAGIAPITDPPGSGDVVLAREDRANWRIGYQVDPATSYKIVVAVYCDDAQAATCDGI